EGAGGGPTEPFAAAQPIRLRPFCVLQAVDEDPISARRDPVRGGLNQVRGLLVSSSRPAVWTEAGESRLIPGGDVRLVDPDLLLPDHRGELRTRLRHPVVRVARPAVRVPREDVEEV